MDTGGPTGPKQKGESRKQIAFSSIFAVVFLLSALKCDASSGTEGAAFLDIPVGAGPAALGSAYSPLATDAYAPIYNPAGLAFVQHLEMAAQHLAYLESIRHEFGSLALPQGFGLAVQDLSSGDIAGTGTHGESIGDFSVHYAAYSLAYGRKVTDKLALGVTGKMISAKIADVSAKAYAGDVGVLYQAGERLSLSATANNLGSKLTFTDQGDSLPTAYHLGAAYRLQSRLKSTIEGVYSKSGLLSGRTGIEWSPLTMMSLRAGYKSDTVKGLSPLAGLTVGLGLRFYGQEFAYAWLPYGDLGDTQYFSFLLKFGARDDKQRNLIRYEALKNGYYRGDGSTVNKAPAHDEPEYQQLMQLLSDEDAPERNALAPAVGIHP